MVLLRNHDTYVNLDSNLNTTVGQRLTPDWDTVLLKIKWPYNSQDTVLYIAYLNHIQTTDSSRKISSVKTIAIKSKQNCSAVSGSEIDNTISFQEFCSHLDVLLSQCPYTSNLEQTLKDQKLEDDYSRIKEQLYTWAILAMTSAQQKAKLDSLSNDYGYRLKAGLDSVASLGNEPAARLEVKRDLAIVFVRDSLWEAKPEVRGNDNSPWSKRFKTSTLLSAINLYNEGGSQKEFKPGKAKMESVEYTEHSSTPRNLSEYY
jgi:hypothetical protein